MESNMIKITVVDGWYNKRWLMTTPKSLFIFGDNMVGEGTGGQAIIRHCPNAFGIPTKRLPSRYPQSYMADKEDELQAINIRLDLLKTMEDHYEEFIFPEAGLGTGLAEMPTRSPAWFKHINEQLYARYGVYEKFIETNLKPF